MKPSISLAVICLFAAFAFYIHRATSSAKEDSGALFVALALCLVAIGWALAVAAISISG